MSDTQSNETLLTPKQVAEKGEQIYKEKLKPILEPKEKGKFVTIEVNSGEQFLGYSLNQRHWSSPSTASGTSEKNINREDGAISISYEDISQLLCELGAVDRNLGKLKRVLGRLLCFLGFHAFHVTEVTFGFGADDSVEKIKCKRCGVVTTRRA